MSRILAVLKAPYNFFAGDAIILSGVVIAFVVAFILERALGASGRQLVTGVVFVALILLSLSVSLARERPERPRRSS
jgi:hypothetical protein